MVKGFSDIFRIIIGQKGVDKLIYEKVKALAKERNLTISRIEKEVDMPQGSICKWDTVEPSASKVRAVADFLGVSTDYLTEGLVYKRNPRKS